MGRAILGSLHNKWKGGKVVHSEGYIMVFTPGHPRANNGHYVLEHVLVAEKALGHALPPKAVVHHFDENKGNNKGDNLIICEDEKYHKFLHVRTGAYRTTGDVNKRQCWICKKWDDPENMRKSGRTQEHQKCKSDYDKDYNLNRRRKYERRQAPLTDGDRAK